MAIKSGKLYAFVGRSRSGKTQKAQDILKSKKHALIWDVEEQYTATIRARTVKDLHRVLVKRYMEKIPAKAERICYTGKLADFNDFCQLAFFWVRVMAANGLQSCIVFEETADVTNPAKAPEHYGILLRRGLKYGVDLLCITQRPAESDKTSIGNASVIHICAMSRKSDKKYMADDTGVPFEVLARLRADQDKSEFDFVSVDTGQGFYQAGCLVFPSNKPKFLINKGKIPL